MKWVRGVALVPGAHTSRTFWRRAHATLGSILVAIMLLNLSACDISQSKSGSTPYVIAGGGTTGVYYSYGKHLAKILSRELDENFTVVETAGSVDNLLRIAEGQALIGFAQSDAAANALAGEGVFAEPLAIRAVARLYDEYVHVVVRQDSDIENLADLKGRPVSLGAKNSGVNLVAMRVLEASGGDVTSVTDLELGPDASIEALRSGQIDAFFWVGGVPTPGVQKLSVNTPLRLLPIGADVVEQLNSEYRGAYRISEFPLGSYDWGVPTTTMTVPNFLVVAKGTSPELVRDITAVLFASRSEMARKVPSAATLDRRQAIFTDPVELHRGAAEYYISAKR